MHRRLFLPASVSDQSGEQIDEAVGVVPMTRVQGSVRSTSLKRGERKNAGLCLATRRFSLSVRDWLNRQPPNGDDTENEPDVRREVCREVCHREDIGFGNLV